MPITLGSEDHPYPSAVTHVTNGQQGNQSTFRAPTEALEKRTSALKEFTEKIVARQLTLLGDSDTSISGVQGAFNIGHKHSGANGDQLIDLNVAYTNGNDTANIGVVNNGSINYKLNGTSSVSIQDSNNRNLLKVSANSSPTEGSLEINLGSATSGFTVKDSSGVELFKIDHSGTITAKEIKLPATAGSAFKILASDGTELLKADNDTKVVTIKTS